MSRCYLRAARTDKSRAMHHWQIANLQAVTSIFTLHGHSLHACCLGVDLRLKGDNAMLEVSDEGG